MRERGTDSESPPTTPHPKNVNSPAPSAPPPPTPAALITAARAHAPGTWRAPTRRLAPGGNQQLALSAARALPASWRSPTSCCSPRQLRRRSAAGARSPRQALAAPSIRDIGGEGAPALPARDMPPRARGRDTGIGPCERPPPARPPARPRTARIRASPALQPPAHQSSPVSPVSLSLSNGDSPPAPVRRLTSVRQSYICVFVSGGGGGRGDRKIKPLNTSH